MAVSLRGFIDWIRNNPIVTIIGIASSTVALIAGIPAAWRAATSAVDLPVCLTYGKKYNYATGYFAKDSAITWVERNADEYHFREIHHNPDFIILLNQTPRIGVDREMIVRLPVCGGTIQWSYENPQSWVDLYETWR